MTLWIRNAALRLLVAFAMMTLVLSRGLWWWIDFSVRMKHVGSSYPYPPADERALAHAEILAWVGTGVAVGLVALAITLGWRWRRAGSPAMPATPPPTKERSRSGMALSWAALACATVALLCFLGAFIAEPSAALLLIVSLIALSIGALLGVAAASMLVTGAVARAVMRRRVGG